jgi:O-antigen/teichoic acid export membrane protein
MDKGFARKTVRAVGWSYASFAAGKLVVLVTTFVLARLLGPEDFGLVSFANLAVSYLAVIQGLGFTAALIRHREDLDEAADTAFSVNLGIGLFLALTTFGMAPLVAEFFHEPAVQPLVQALALTFLIDPLGAVHVARLQRELEFGRKMVTDLGRSMMKGVVGIGCALAGYGVWALVIGQLAGQVVGIIAVWVVAPWRPRFRFDPQLAGRLFGFSLPLFLVEVQSAIWLYLDYTIVGRFLGSEALGIYTLAYRIPELTIISLWMVLGGVMFPAFASVQDQPDKLKRGFLATLRYVQLAAVPLSLGLLVTADPLVRVLLGEEWLEVIPVLRLLAVYSLIGSIGTNGGDVFKAVGRSDILWRQGCINLIVLVICLLQGVRFGLEGVAMGHIVAASVAALIRLVTVSRVIQLSFGEILRELRPSLVGGAAFALLSLPMVQLSVDMAPLIRLILIGAAGGMGYFAALWALERDALVKAGELVGVRIG